jgi:hypothetical protein
MTKRFTYTANAAAAIAALAALLILGSAAGHAGPIPGSDQYNLQQQMQQELNNLAQTYQRLASAPGADQAQLRWDYLTDAYKIKQYYLSQDTRGQMTNDLIQRNAKLDAEGNPVLDDKGKIVSDIENTGSAPKDVRADVDLNAKTPEAAQNAIDGWQADGHVLLGPDQQPLGPIDWNNPPYKVVDATTDTTLWLPCNTPACAAAKVRDPDAWTTEGGLQGTGNSGKVQDPWGYYLDNEKKFAHAQDALEDIMNGGTADMSFDDALKTAAKSLYKAALASGVDNSDLLAQADALRNYADPVEAGIADPGDSPGEVARKVQEWLQNADAAMTELKGIAKAAGEALTAKRFADADNLLDNPADPDAYEKALKAKKIIDDQGRVDASNEPAESVNIDLGGVGAKAPPTKPPSLAERLGATSTSPKCLANGAMRAGVGAGVGAVIGAAATYEACLLTALTTGSGSEKECRDAALSKENIGQAAFWGAVAALGPWGEIVAAVYGGAMGTYQTGTMVVEMAKTASALQQEDLVRQTREIFQPIDDEIGNCNLGKALLMAQQAEQQHPMVGKLFVGMKLNYTPLINRLKSQTEAEKQVEKLVRDANAETDPAKQAKDLSDALKAGQDGNVPPACMLKLVPPSCPPPTEATNSGTGPPAACANPTWICSYKDASGKTVNSLMPPNVSACPTACVASNGLIASYMWNPLAGSGSSGPSSFNGRPVVQANSTAQSAPYTQGGCPYGQRNGNFANVGGAVNYGCMCASGDWVAYRQSCSTITAFSHLPADPPIVGPPTYDPSTSPPPSAAVSAPPPSAALLPLASTPIPPLNAPNAGILASATTASGSSGYPSLATNSGTDSATNSGTNSGTSFTPRAMTKPAAPTQQMPPNQLAATTPAASSPATVTPPQHMPPTQPATTTPTASPPTTATPPPQHAAAPLTLQYVNSGSCSIKDGVQTCTEDGKIISTTKVPDASATTPSSGIKLQPQPPSTAPGQPANTTGTPPPNTGPLKVANASSSPGPVQACESKPPFLPWGGQGSATITVSGGKPCGIGWHDTGATILDSMSVTSPPSHGSLKPQDQHVIIFTPASGYKGPDSFTLSMQEHNGGRRATMSVKVSVTVQ